LARLTRRRWHTASPFRANASQAAPSAPWGRQRDGGTTLAFYKLVANACNAPSRGACRAAGTPPSTHVERQLSWTVVR